MCEDCDWPTFIICCYETICLCCINCSHNISPTYFNTQETNITNPVNPNKNYIVQQPLNQGNSYSPKEYSPQQELLREQQTQCPTAPNSELNPGASFLEKNYNALNQSSEGIVSSNYTAPPSYAESVGNDSYKVPSSGSSYTHNKKY